MVKIKKAIVLAQQTAKVPRDRMEVLVVFICPLLFFNKKIKSDFLMLVVVLRICPLLRNLLSLGKAVVPQHQPLLGRLPVS